MQCANNYPVILTVKFAFSEGGCALPFQATDLWKSLGHTASFKDQKLRVRNPKNIQSTPDISVLEQNENKNWKQNKAKAPFLAHFQREENNIFLSITKQDRWEHTPCWSEQADVLEQTPAHLEAQPESLPIYAMVAWVATQKTSHKCAFTHEKTPLTWGMKGYEYGLQCRNNNLVKSNVFCLKLVFLRFHNIIFSFQEWKQ